jgi:hypothetical protein
VAEPRTFGRRQVPVVQTAPVASGPASYGPDDPERRGTTAERLDRFGRTLRLAGELVGYGGLLLYLLSGVLLAASDAGTVLTKVYIPPVLQDALHFDSPAIQHVEKYLVPMVGSLAWPLLVLVGAIAMFRRRFLLGGLCVATLLFPWSLVGVWLPFGTVPAVVMIGLGVVRFLDLRGLNLAVTIVVGLVVGVPVVIMASRWIDGMLWPNGVPAVSYAVIEGADLDANIGLPSQGVDAAGRPVVRISDFDWLPDGTPEQRVAKAFAQVQLATARNDVPGILAALTIIDAAPVKLNSVEAGRTTAARNFAAVQGAFGPEEQSRVTARVNATSASAEIARWAGTILGLFGPFAGVVAGILRRRSRRIETAEAQLAAHREQPAARATAGRSFGRLASSEPMASFAAADGTAVIGAMSSRIDLYRIAAIVLGLVAVLALAASFLMRLPPGDSNTAFDAVDLTTIGGTWALTKNLPHATGLPPIDALVGQWLIGGLAIAAIAYRIRKPIGLGIVGIVLFGLVYWQINGLFFVHTAHYEARPASFTATLRSELEMAARQQSTDTPDSMPIEPGTAGFILAQLDYLEGNTARIGAHLSEVAGSQFFRLNATTAEDQRVDLMADWAAANGRPVEIKKGANLIVPMAAVRAAVQPLLLIGLGSAALVGLVLGLAGYASRRRETLQDLVSESQRVSR